MYQRAIGSPRRTSGRAISMPGTSGATINPIIDRHSPATTLLQAFFSIFIFASLFDTIDDALRLRYPNIVDRTGHRTIRSLERTRSFATIIDHSTLDTTGYISGEQRMARLGYVYHYAVIHIGDYGTVVIST